MTAGRGIKRLTKATTGPILHSIQPLVHDAQLKLDLIYESAIKRITKLSSNVPRLNLFFKTPNAKMKIKLWLKTISTRKNEKIKLSKLKNSFCEYFHLLKSREALRR